MMHLSSDMSASIANNFTSILHKYKIKANKPQIEFDEDLEILSISCCAEINHLRPMYIEYTLPCGLVIEDVAISAGMRKKNIHNIVRFIKNLKKIRNQIDAMVIPYIKEEF